MYAQSGSSTSYSNPTPAPKLWLGMKPLYVMIGGGVAVLILILVVIGMSSSERVVPIRGNGKAPRTPGTSEPLDSSNEELGGGGGSGGTTRSPADLVKFVDKHTVCHLGDLYKANLLHPLKIYSQDKKLLDGLSKTQKWNIERLIESLQKRQQIIDILSSKKLPLNSEDKSFLEINVPYDQKNAMIDLALTESEFKTANLIVKVNDIFADNIVKGDTFKKLHDHYSYGDLLPKIFKDENYDILFKLCDEDLQSKLSNIRVDYLRVKKVEKICDSKTVTLDDEDDLLWTLGNGFCNYETKNTLEMLLNHIQLAKLALNKCSLKELEGKHKEAWRIFEEIKGKPSKLAIKDDANVNQAIQRLIDDFKLKGKLEAIAENHAYSTESFSNEEKAICTDDVLARANDLGMQGYKLSTLYDLARNSASPAEKSAFESNNAELLAYIRRPSSDHTFDNLTAEAKHQFKTLKNSYLLSKDERKTFEKIKDKLTLVEALDSLDETTGKLEEDTLGISENDLKYSFAESFFNNNQREKAQRIVKNMSNMKYLTSRYSYLVDYLKEHPNPELKDFVKDFRGKQLATMDADDVIKLFPSNHAEIEDLRVRVKAHFDALELLEKFKTRGIIYRSDHIHGQEVLKTVLQNLQKYALDDDQRLLIEKALDESFNCTKVKQTLSKRLDAYCASKHSWDRERLHILFDHCKWVCESSNEVLEPSLKYTSSVYILLELADKVNQNKDLLENLYGILNHVAKELPPSTDLPQVESLRLLYLKKRNEVEIKLNLSSMTPEHQNLILQAFEQLSSGNLLTDTKYKGPLEAALTFPLSTSFSETIRYILKCYDTDKKPLFDWIYQRFLTKSYTESAFQLLNSLYPLVKSSLGATQDTFFEYTIEDIKSKPIEQKKNLFNVAEFLGSKSPAGKALFKNLAEQIWPFVKEENVGKIVQWINARASTDTEQYSRLVVEALKASNVMEKFLQVVEDDANISSYRLKLKGYSANIIADIQENLLRS